MTSKYNYGNMQYKYNDNELMQKIMNKLMNKEQDKSVKFSRWRLVMNDTNIQIIISHNE